MDNDIVYSSCKDIDTLLCIENKKKALEIKITTYIDIYNVKYTKLYDTIKDDSNTDTDSNTNNPIIKYTSINLERIGNIERLYKNFNNTTKYLNKELRYSIHKTHILIILDTLHYIMNRKDRYFDFNLYSYELYNVIGVDNVHVIQKKNKNLNYNFTGSCIMLIFIRDKMFIHYY
jgi:hypothetical protein